MDKIKKIREFQDDCYYVINNIKDFKSQFNYLQNIYKKDFYIKDCNFVLNNVCAVRIR